ncbi:MAG: response regulator [Chloroflexota bacterium]
MKYDDGTGIPTREQGGGGDVARIAVVNDDTAFLTLMGQLIEDEGWEALSLREGSSAYEHVKREHPDVMILDLRLEQPDEGWKILELVKLDPETQDIPIIVCSAAVDDLRLREQWLSDHGVATLLKPFDIDDLYTAIRLALSRRRQPAI